MNYKIIHTLLISVLLFFSSKTSAFAQSYPGMSEGEFLVINYSDKADGIDNGNGEQILFRMYPIGAMFNGNYKYSPNAHDRITYNDPSEITDSFIVGYQKILDTTIIPSTQQKYYVRGAADYQTSNSECNFQFGMALYKIEFWSLIPSTETPNQLLNSLLVDWRTHLSDSYPYDMDLIIEYYSADSIMFHFISGTNNHINVVGKHIKHWQQYGAPFQDLTRKPDLGLFTVDNSKSEFLNFPINAKSHNGNLGHVNPGEIGMNLKIDHNVSTHSTLITHPNPTTINVTPNTKFSIASNKSFTMVTPISSYNEFILDSVALLELETNSQFIVNAPNKLTLKNHSSIKSYANSEIQLKSGSHFCNEGSDITGQVKIHTNGNVSFCPSTADFVSRDSVNIFINDSSEVEIPDDYTLRLTGVKASLILKPYSKIKLGQNSKIILDSGATLIANNASFISSDTSETWEGIILNNSGVDSIINCTFSNAKTSLSIINDANHSNTNRIIKGNTFNIPAGELGRGIYGENNYRLLVQNNTFNMPVASSLTPDLALVGLYLKNSSIGGAAGEPIETESSPYSLNIVGNTFNNGCASAILANYLSNVLPYNIHRNTFNHTNSANLIGIQISGAIKNNEFTSDDVPLGIHLVNSSPDLYNNEIEAKNVALHLAANSYPNLAPTVSGGDMIWNGGSNKLHTTDIDNIQLSSAANIFTDWGNNNFSVDASGAYHIYGWLDSAVNNYYTRDNCWDMGSNAFISLCKDETSLIVPAVYLNFNYDCSTPASVTDWIITNKGNGIYDSVKVTADISTGGFSEADLLYFQAEAYMSASNYPGGIATSKNLIGLDSSILYHGPAYLLMYEAYSRIDTSANLQYHNDLWTDLIDFLENEIDLERSGDEELALEIMAMCYLNLEELGIAYPVYEMLALYHPDPNIRLAASWNYEELQDLIENGEGGGNLEHGI